MNDKTHPASGPFHSECVVAGWGEDSFSRLPKVPDISRKLRPQLSHRLDSMEGPCVQLLEHRYLCLRLSGMPRCS